MIRYIFFTTIFIFPILGLSDTSSLQLDYKKANYNFEFRSAIADKNLSYFENCEEHRGLAASAADEISHISAIHNEGVVIVTPVDSNSGGAN